MGLFRELILYVTPGPKNTSALAAQDRRGFFCILWNGHRNNSATLTLQLPIKVASLATQKMILSLFDHRAHPLYAPFSSAAF